MKGDIPLFTHFLGEGDLSLFNPLINQQTTHTDWLKLLFTLGKSSFLASLLEEFRFHFTSIPKRLLYFYKHDDAQIQRLKTFFEKNREIDARFLKKIPEDLSPLLLPHQTVIVWDDHELYFNARENAEYLYSISSVLTSHLGLIVFFNVNSFSVLRKDSIVHRSIQNSTHLIFFKTRLDTRSLKNFMGNFSLQLKGNQSLWDIYNKHIQKSSTQFAYLLLCVSPKCRKSTCYTNILMQSSGPMISFHESDSESETEWNYVKMACKNEKNLKQLVEIGVQEKLFEKGLKTSDFVTFLEVLANIGNKEFFHCFSPTTLEKFRKHRKIVNKLLNPRRSLKKRKKLLQTVSVKFQKFCYKHLLKDFFHRCVEPRCEPRSSAP